MLLLSIPWLIDIIGRFHPLMVHFPIGLLIGAFVLEGITKLQKKESPYIGMVYLGAFSAFVAAIMGQLLSESGDYGGGLLRQHQWTGWATVILANLTALLYLSLIHI